MFPPVGLEVRSNVASVVAEAITATVRIGRINPRLSGQHEYAH